MFIIPFRRVEPEDLPRLHPHVCALLPLLLMLWGCAASWEEQEKEVPPVHLDEIRVTAERLPPRDRILPPSLRVVDAEALRDRPVLSVPDALEGEPGVVVQKTALGGGSPIVRGRTGKEVLLLVDGQRFNNSTFRRNNQYLNTLDLNAVDRMEVIYGPASVAFGSDAMGGAVNVITRRWEPSGADAIHGRILERYESADRGLTHHLGLEGELGGFGFTGGITYKDLDDLRAGRHGDPAGAVDTRGRQVPTGYREHAASFSLTRRLSALDTLDLLVLESRQEDVPRSDRLIPNAKQPDPPDLFREYDPQVLRWYALRWRRRDPGAFLESLTVTASLDNPREGRNRIKASSPDTLRKEEDEVTVPGFSARVGLRPSMEHLLTAGLEGYFEKVDSSARTEDLSTGAVTVEPFGRYPDGARYQSLGFYVQEEWRITDRVRWTNGIRGSWFRVHLDLEGLAVGPLPPFGSLTERYDDVTFATSLTGRVSEHTDLYGSLSRGFRAPNLHDLGTVGDFASGNRIPNLDLDPESVWNLEVGARRKTERIAAGAALSTAWYRDLFDDRYVFTDQGEDYFRVENTARAVLYSLETWMEAKVHVSGGGAPVHALFARAFLNRGRNRTEREPLSKVPPPSGTLGYRLEAGSGDKWFAEAYLRGALPQHRLSASDEADPRIPVDGTPAWWTANLRAGWTPTPGFRLVLALENLFDRRYRVHGSGIDAPGFDALLSLAWFF